MIKSEALAVSSILQMAESRANGRPVPGHSSSSHEQYRALYIAMLVLPIVMAGCGGGGTPTGPAPGPSIYLTQDLPEGPKLLQFSTTANGIVSPTVVPGPSANIGFSEVAVDETGNAYVGGSYINTFGPPYYVLEILVYAPGASGTKPTKTINIGVVGFSSHGIISGLAVDSSGNVYVSGTLDFGYGVAIFSSTANGDAVPIRAIDGSATAIIGQGPMPVAVDSADNIYVSSGDLMDDSILIFNSSANGNVPPTSTIGGPATTINSIQGLALDNAGNVYVSNVPSGQNALPDILEFSAGSTGNVAPTRIISGSATLTKVGGSLALDSAGNIYVLDVPNLLKFAPNATGNVAPIAMITTATGLIAGGIAVH